MTHQETINLAQRAPSYPNMQKVVWLNTNPKGGEAHNFNYQPSGTYQVGQTLHNEQPAR